MRNESGKVVFCDIRVRQRDDASNTRTLSFGESLAKNFVPGSI